MIATRDVGTIAAAALLDPAAFPKAIEIAGDALTGSGIAAGTWTLEQWLETVDLAPAS